MKPFSIIVGYRASDRAIGANGKLPWHIPKDMDFFRKITTTTETLTYKNAVIMGRNTFEGMDRNPLPGRINFVFTSSEMVNFPDRNIWHISDSSSLPNDNIDTIESRRSIFPPLYFVKTLDDALKICHIMAGLEKVFVIGGEQLYRYAIEHPLCEELIVNEFSSQPGEFDIDKIPCDTFFPEIDENEYKIIETNIRVDNNEKMFQNVPISCKNRLFDMSHITIKYKQYIRYTV